MSERQTYKTRAVDVRNAARSHLKDLRQQRMSKRRSVGVAGSVALEAEGMLPVPEVDTVRESASAQDLENLSEAAERAEAPKKSVGSASAADTEEPEDTSLDELNDLAVHNAAMTEMTHEITPVVELAEPPIAAFSEETVASDAHCPLAETMQDETASYEPAAENAEIEDRRVEAETATAEEANVGHEPVMEAETASEPEAVMESEGSVASEVPYQGDLTTLPGAGPGLVWMLKQCGIQSLDDLAQADASDLSRNLGVVGQILDVEKWIVFAKQC